MSEHKPILDMRGITKHFNGLAALHGVDFSVRQGEIHALLGQNGAGKSTLMKILAGVYPLEEGQMWINGAAVSFRHPHDALRMGVGTVYQDLSLVPHLSVADNVFLGREAGGFVINERRNLAEAAHILDDLGVQNIDVRARVGTLPLAQQQLVEIAKVLSYKPRILVLDEPTAALAEGETSLLFNLIDSLRAKQIAIIFISHRFKEVIAHCERATVLRNGQLVKTLDLANVSEEELVELTIGDKVETFFRVRGDMPPIAQEQLANSDVVLEVEQLSVGRAVRNVSFSVQRGEIVGITGLLGAGQNELARALFGVATDVSGVIRRNGSVVTIQSPRQAVQLGIGLLTEHRKREGLVLDMTVRENITLPSLSKFPRVGVFIRGVEERRTAQHFADSLNIKAASINARVATLSGGNQQKVILAKWLLRDLEVLIFIAPTQGIDVGAKAEIYHELGRLAQSGKAIIVVTEDLVELLGVSDRILVMYNGQLVETLMRGAATEESLLSAIQGSTHGA